MLSQKLRIIAEQDDYSYLSHTLNIMAKKFLKKNHLIHIPLTINGGGKTHIRLHKIVRFPTLNVNRLSITLKHVIYALSLLTLKMEVLTYAFISQKMMGVLENL